MKSSSELKKLVMQKYADIATQEKSNNLKSCCGAGSCSSEVYNIMTDSYENVSGYDPDADLGLGCGLPTEYAFINNGDTVLDLGSGAGNDAFVARNLTGPEGKVIGVDFTEAMISKARINAEKLGYHNVEFRLGDIEDLPVTKNSVDVIISNCVLNLVPDKQKAFGEMFRVLNEGGHFSISDVVLKGELPESLLKAAEMYAGCVTGALQKDKFIKLLEEIGFTNIKVQKEKTIVIPEDILSDYLDTDEREVFQKNKNIIFSITVYGEKPKKCCTDTGCC